jgi:5-methylthioadenosine/S-adenosylhomocysteine deaminase
MPATTIIKPRWIVTVNPDFDVLTESVVIVENDRIKAIQPLAELDATAFEDAELVELDNHVLMPGLVNAHGHAAMSLLRGIADDLALMTWLQEHIWPAESKWVDRQFIEDGVRLAAAEMIRGGTTCCNDMYFFPDVMARTCQQMGMRAVAGLIVLDFPTVWAASADDYLAKAMATHDEIREYPLVTTALAPHAPYTVSDAPLEKIAMYSSELDLPVHMHVHETAHEVDEALANSGMRPLQRLDQLGLLNPNLLAVHMTQVEELEFERLAETGVNVAHCPESNLKLASGFCPVKRLLDQGVNVCIGTDGAASNNDLDMFGEMRSAALLAKNVAGDASACPAEQAIRMATINGARALGLEHAIGSIEPDKKADLVAVDFSQTNSQPVYNPVAQLVYAINALQVSDTWINGVRKLDNYQLTDIDAVEIIQNAQQWQHKISTPA